MKFDIGDNLMEVLFWLIIAAFFAIIMFSGCSPYYSKRQHDEAYLKLYVQMEVMEEGIVDAMEILADIDMKLAAIELNQRNLRMATNANTSKLVLKNTTSTLFNLSEYGVIKKEGAK